jgi:glucosyl-dolichyl phosphate glucuronosyltransferase
MGGRIIPRYIPAKPKWISYHVASLVGNFDYSKDVVEFAAEKYPLESNMIVAKKDFDAIQGFSTSIPGVKGTLRIGGEGKDFFMRLKATGKSVYYSPNVIVEHIVEVEKLTPEYMYRVASGIGRGERVRMLQKGKWPFIKKIIEYGYKLAGSFVLGISYLLKGSASQFWPVIKYRIDALKGLLNR